MAARPKPRRIADTLFPASLESRRQEIEEAASAAGVGQAYLWVFALGMEYERRSAAAPAEHIFQGSCPDETTGPASRDPDCPACRALGA